MKNILKSNSIKKAITFLLLTLSMSGSTHAQLAFDWVVPIKSSSGLNRGTGIALDGEGGVYVTGAYSNTVDFDPGPDSAKLTPGGSPGAYVAKYDASGNFVWVTDYTINTNNWPSDIAVDDSGNIYTVGFYGIGTTVGFINKFDAAGNKVWNKGYTGKISPKSITTDTYGNIYVTGIFDNVGNFNPSGQALLNAFDGSVFVAKYDANGNYIWAKNMACYGDFDGQHGGSIAVDVAGNVYITGLFGDSYNVCDFDPGPGIYTLTSAGGRGDIFVCKLDSAGNFVWAKRMGGELEDGGSCLALDTAGNVYISGYFGGLRGGTSSFQYTVDFDPGPGTFNLVSAGNQDIFISKLDSSGNFIWAKSMGGPDFELAYSITVDAAGYVYTTGVFGGVWPNVSQVDGTADFDPGPGVVTLTSVGGYDIFISKLDAQGNYVWAGSMGSSGGSDGFSSGTDGGLGIAVDASGSVYTTGYVQSTIDFDPGPGVFSIACNRDAYVHKLLCTDTSSSSLYIEICSSSYTLNKETYTATGTYVQKIPNTRGCDSTIILDLTFYQLDPAIRVDSFTLSVAGIYATYQWLKNGVAIPGATDSIYKVTENAEYQVVVTNEDGCIDTSDVYPITNVSIEDINKLSQYIHVYPNPAGDAVYIQSPVKVQVLLTDIEGRTIRPTVKDAGKITVSDLADGVYFLRITDQNNHLIKVEKIIKQR